MDKFRRFVANFGLVIGLALLVVAALMALFAKGHDAQQFATSQSFALAGIGFVIAGRK